MHRLKLVLCTIALSFGFATACGSEGLEPEPTDDIAVQQDELCWREVGDSSVITTLPAEPGLPEGVVAKGTRIYTSTPAGFTNFGDAIVYVHSKYTGELIKEVAIPPVHPGPNSLSGLAPGLFGDMYVLNPMQAGVVRFNDYLDTQEVYTPNGFPDLPPCAINDSVPCSPTVPVCEPYLAMGMPCSAELGRPALPNSLAFGPMGELYVTDTFQATIWRIPAGGGDPEIWFQDSRIDDAFGPNGIRVSLIDDHVYFIVSGLSTANSWIYKLPRIDSPQAEDLELVHQFTQGEGPDELTFALSGNIYVSTALASAIVKLSPQGEVLDIYPGITEGSVVMHGPAGLDFDGLKLVIANHASLPQPTPSNYAILDMFVGELGMPYYQPFFGW